MALHKKFKTKNTIDFPDKLRIFKGDKPAAQFEADQQKGRNFYCFSCATHAETASSYVHIHSLAIETIHDRVNQVMKTELSLSKSKQQKLKLYECLDKEEIVIELRAHSVKFSCTELEESELEEIN